MLPCCRRAHWIAKSDSSLVDPVICLHTYIYPLHSILLLSEALYRDHLSSDPRTMFRSCMSAAGFSKVRRATRLISSPYLRIVNLNDGQRSVSSITRRDTQAMICRTIRTVPVYSCRTLQASVIQSSGVLLLASLLLSAVRLRTSTNPKKLSTQILKTVFATVPQWSLPCPLSLVKARFHNWTQTSNMTHSERPSMTVTLCSLVMTTNSFRRVACIDDKDVVLEAKSFAVKSTNLYDREIVRKSTTTFVDPDTDLTIASPFQKVCGAK